MNKEPSVQIGEWYWIHLKGFDGRPFGKILKIIAPNIVKIRLCIFRNNPVNEIENPETLIDTRYIGNKLSAEENVNIITKSIL